MKNRIANILLIISAALLGSSMLFNLQLHLYKVADIISIVSIIAAALSILLYHQDNMEE